MRIDQLIDDEVAVVLRRYGAKALCQAGAAGRRLVVVRVHHEPVAAPFSERAVGRVHRQGKCPAAGRMR